MTNYTDIKESFNRMAGAFMIMCLNPANHNNERGDWANAYREHASLLEGDEYSLEDTNDAIETLIEFQSASLIEFVKSTLIYDY